MRLVVLYPLDGPSGFVEEVVLVSFLREHPLPLLWQVLVPCWLAGHAPGVVVRPEGCVEETVKEILHIYFIWFFAKAGFCKGDFLFKIVFSWEVLASRRPFSIWQCGPLYLLSAMVVGGQVWPSF